MWCSRSFSLIFRSIWFCSVSRIHAWIFANPFSFRRTIRALNFLSFCARPDCSRRKNLMPPSSDSSPCDPTPREVWRARAKAISSRELLRRARAKHRLINECSFVCPVSMVRSLLLARVVEDFTTAAMVRSRALSSLAAANPAPLVCGSNPSRITSSLAVNCFSASRHFSISARRPASWAPQASREARSAASWASSSSFSLSIWALASWVTASSLTAGSVVDRGEWMLEEGSAILLPVRSR
mmetsp:Transcript_77870/g.208085  ORF Transcript_77870/g.208085 Transcript_77870/m.208085 type:complete len:241 (-) Transcript_77870:902-1624(-)